MKTSKFNFFIPLQKDSLTKSEKDGKETYYFEGLASDGTTDADEENLNPEGFELEDFKFINWNHGKDPEDHIGVPIESKIIKDNTGKAAFYVKGMLFNSTKKGSATISLMKALEEASNKTGKNVNLGISVEGQVTERNLLNPKKVEKARITAIALCPFPKNPNTWASLIRKGFVADEIEKPLEPSFNYKILSRIIGDEYITIDNNLNILKSKVSEALEKSLKIIKKSLCSVKNLDKTGQ